MNEKTKNSLSLEDFSFDLPSELIAERPISPRDHSRLLVYNAATETVEHLHFYDLPELLDSTWSIAFNRSKVFPCRLNLFKRSGGKAEIFFLERELSQFGSIMGYKALLKCSGKQKKGMEFVHKESVFLLEHIFENGEVLIACNEEDLSSFLEREGQVPIPPYIRKGKADERDKADYQTAFARDEGSVAAPTAGLHFTNNVLDKLKNKNIEFIDTTLHVGLGTFLPVKSENISEHKMHSEKYLIDKENWKKIKQKEKLLTIGTTALRSVESAYKLGSQFAAGKEYDTDIFFYPGQGPELIDGLLTNFHLPKSSLLMLVSSIIGREKTLELYNLAISERYRFFSYGDAMLILR